MTSVNDIIRAAHRDSMAYLNREQQAAFIRECRRRRGMATLRKWAKSRLHSLWCDANHQQNERYTAKCKRRQRFYEKMRAE